MFHDRWRWCGRRSGGRRTLPRAFGEWQPCWLAGDCTYCNTKLILNPNSVPIMCRNVTSGDED